MENIVVDVRDMDGADRRTIEHLVGTTLQDDQRLVIQIVNPQQNDLRAFSGAAAGELPDWCNVYEGLNDVEIAEIEQSIIRSNDTRSLA